ncbi:MAG: aldehyde ferredoxin oxidoreductase family protein [Bacteroidetes bacterium]|nr:aldehyde ferredoxin oxidoreductase family protein [Bacteroidota bacterium]
MYGITGQRLRLDMSNRTYKIEKPGTDYYKKWIGGRGSNSEVAYHETHAGMDPFDPDNPLCFGAGPLVATFAPLAGRTTVTCRSPLTCSLIGTDVHGHGDTNMGSGFGPFMKYAGFDQIIVKGKSDKPVWVYIENDKVEFRDASHLWGLGTKKATLKMMDEIGETDVRIALIGPAGEKLVRFACIMNSFSASGGRTGMGAVMGAKNLKAIAIRGTRPVKIAKPDEFMKAAWALRERIHTSPSAIRRRIEGTLDLFDVGNEIGINAHKNCSTGYMEGLEELYGGIPWAEKFLFRRKSCWSCPVGCGRYTYIKEGRYAGFFCGGPEMESLCNLGPRIDSRDVEGVTVLCGIVNELGMDSISAGAALSWSMEAFEKGYISEKDTGGIRFDWGDIETSMKVLNMIANREGFGDLLAEGNIRVAEKLGVGMDIVPHCRGLEHISVDPRVALGFSLGYAMSTRGSDHLKNYSCLEFPGAAQSRAYQINEILTKETSEKFWENFPSQMWKIDTKPELCHWSEKNKCVADLVGCCCQAIGSWGGAGNWKEAYAPLFRYATGLDMSDDEIFTASERVINIERAHWNRDGSGIQDDTHIDRYFDEPVVGGPHKGLKLDREQWAWAQQEYYKLKGWDSVGFITPEKAKELGIKEIVPDVEKGKTKCIKWLKKQVKTK